MDLTKTQIETEYDNFQAATSWFAHAGEGSPGELIYLVLGLVGEAGEFADAVKKIVRESGVTSKEAFEQILLTPGVQLKLIDELGDTMWYLNALMRFLGITHSELLVHNTYKLYTRIAARPKEGVKLYWPFENAPHSQVHADMQLLKDKEHDNVC